MLADQISEVGNMLGLLLALATLFTAHLEERLATERLRTGGPKKSALKSVQWISAGLAIVTFTSLLSLSQLVGRVLGTVGNSGTVDPTLTVFAMVWVLLVALLVWQLALSIRARAAAR